MSDEPKAEQSEVDKILASIKQSTPGGRFRGLGGFGRMGRAMEMAKALRPSLEAKIGDGSIRVESGWITPGVASVFGISAGRTVFNEHATPDQLREAAALFLWTAVQIERDSAEASR